MAADKHEIYRCSAEKRKPLFTHRLTLNAVSESQIHRREEYRSWADLSTSRKTEVLMDGQWLPVIVKKSNFQMVQRSMGLNPVEITFQMADPKQGL